MPKKWRAQGADYAQNYAQTMPKNDPLIVIGVRVVSSANNAVQIGQLPPIMPAE